MEKVVIIKFKNSKPYFFRSDVELKKGQNVVVETSRGTEYGVVVNPAYEAREGEITQPLKPILRVANEKDNAIIAEHEARRAEAMRVCREKIEAHGLNMKLIDCEFTFDGSKVIFTFTAESRVDFRELVKDLAAYFHLRIELRQVGARDETRILGGIAPCGRVCCCASCMPELKKVSIKMAKNQGLSLNPNKISGLCGRLMCCLSYENDYYADAFKKMPKMGSMVDTPEGKGAVISTDMLKMTVRVKIEKEGALLYRDFPVAELKFGNATPQEADDDEDGDGDKISE